MCKICFVLFKNDLNVLFRKYNVCFQTDNNILYFKIFELIILFFFKFRTK